MCGINGFISFDEQLTEDLQSIIHSNLSLMNDSIVHRGPDSEGLFIKNPIGFGFRRLSIIDLSDIANQPMLSNDGQIALVFNGEIYNYIELKRELLQKGYIFRTNSDTEVIINSYIEYGEECVQKFNGMWAFAIYDFRIKKLFCSRDRLGVKPFYYSIQNRVLYFSSELKALHRACNLKYANHGKVYEYLAYGYRSNDGETFYESCNELLPGTNLIYENEKITINKFWRLDTNKFILPDNLNWHQAYEELFEDAVKLRYRSDVPVALLLSGGLDSTAIAKVTDNLIESGELPLTDIHAFIASFPKFKEDETPLARAFIKTCKHIKLHELIIDPKSITEDFENLVYGFDHPVFSFTSVAHNMIMKQCSKQGIKVVLNGQGSDEAFAGYDRYISGVHLVDILKSNPKQFLTEFKTLNKVNKYSKSFLSTQMLKAIFGQEYSSFLRAKYQEKSIAYLNNNFVKQNVKHFRSQYKFTFSGDNFNKYLLNQINYQGLNTILHYEDVSSMMHSVEIRSPFMDYRLMEFAFSLPNELKFRNGITKVIQRETIGKMLPDIITKNRNKIGFKTPFTDYITNSEFFKSYIFDVLNSTSFHSKNIWKAKDLAQIFKNPQKNPSFPFWRFLNLEVWSQKYDIKNL